MEVLVHVARAVLLTTAACCLALSALHVGDAVRAIIAQRRLRRGDYAGALSIYERLLRRPWQTYSRRRMIAYNAAVCLHRDGNLRDCRRLLEHLIAQDLDPTLDSLSHALLGQTLVLLGTDLDRAEASLARAGVRLDFSHFGLTRAILNLMLGDPESARRDFECFQTAGSAETLVGLQTVALVEREFEATMRDCLLGIYHLLCGDRAAALPRLEAAASARVKSLYREHARRLLAFQAG